MLWLCAAHAARAGPFRDVMAADFHGKVRDKRCRKPLYTPSNWDPKVDAARSAELPNARLVLQFVYGFNGEGAPTGFAPLLELYMPVPVC